jgi:hypothetical protein
MRILNVLLEVTIYSGILMIETICMLQLGEDTLLILDKTLYFPKYLQNL